MPGNDVGQALVDQATAQELLKLIHSIADPCEDIIAKAGVLAGDPSQPPEIQQASADLAATVEQEGRRYAERSDVLHCCPRISDWRRSIRAGRLLPLSIR